MTKPTVENDLAKRFVELIKVIRPPLPSSADYSLEDKARMFDLARVILYDDRGTVRPLRMTKLRAALLIAALSTASMIVLVQVVRAVWSAVEFL